jgi:hypothetical protein
VQHAAGFAMTLAVRRDDQWPGDPDGGDQQYLP